MSKPASDDFSAIMEQTNQMSQSGISHPFGVRIPEAGRGSNLKVRQTTEVFCLPRDREGYDALFNRLWSGEGTVRYEERTFTKEGEFMVVVCHFAPVGEPQQPQPVGLANLADGDAEAEIKPYRIP